jgi:hypothetical protein
MCFHAIPFIHTQHTTNQKAPIRTPEQDCMDVMDNVDDVANDDSDDNCEFSDDEDDFVMMKHAAMPSQKIATESATTKVSFMCA